MAGPTVNPYRFGGQVGYRRDSGSTQYVRARHLDAGKGRWASRDPIGFDSGDSNLYRYVGNNPVIGGDPSGLRSNCQYCGPDISSTLRNTMKKVDKKFGVYSLMPGMRTLLCTLMFDPIDGWDITPLHNDYDWIINQEPKCATCVDKHETINPPNISVTVDGKCFHPWTINYVLWGRMCLLCGLSIGAAIGAVIVNKGLGHTGEDLTGAVNWAQAGYLGWPLFPTPRETNVWGDCSPCPTAWPANDFPVHWKPLFWGASKK